MLNFRQIITRELKRQKKTVYWLGKLEHTPAANSIYRYMRHERDMNGDNIATILDALKVSCVAKRKARR